jgi:hypothetical protein
MDGPFSAEPIREDLDSLRDEIDVLYMAARMADNTGDGTATIDRALGGAVLHLQSIESTLKSFEEEGSE